MEKQDLKQSSKGSNEVFFPFIKIRIVWGEVLSNGGNRSWLPTNLAYITAYSVVLQLVAI